MEFDKTMHFSLEKEKNVQSKDVLKEVYQALVEKGYNPINQIVGYILSGDPTYITSYNDARNLIRQLDRDELLETLVRSYIGLEEILKKLEEYIDNADINESDITNI